MNSSLSLTQNKTEFQRLVNLEIKRFNDQLQAQNLESEITSHSEDNTSFGINGSLTEQLQQWYQQYNPPDQCVNDLLLILNNEGLGVPINVKCLRSDSASGNPWSNVELNAHNIKNENCKDTNCVISDIQAQQNQIYARLKLMMTEIAKAKVRIDENDGITEAINKSSEIFPIQTEEDLHAFENSLDDTNINTHIISLKNIIRNEGIKTSLTRIISERILFEHNYDGRNNKLAINSYPKLLNVLFRAYEGIESQIDFTRHLKLAMKRVKNRHHKMNWQNRQNKNKADNQKSMADDANEDEDDDYDDDEFFN